MAEDITAPKLLPHHEQQDLCSTRLPYRQGRKLTAVKVYTVNNESRHLLIFGVPSLSLRQETKRLFSRFGKLLLYITKYPSEPFTETYHAIFEDIQAARRAKKMLDTKSFYGGILHISYAPEFESLNDTKAKLLQRQKNVVTRLKNLQKTTVTKNYDRETVPEQKIVQKDEEIKKLYMGNENNIEFGKRKADIETVQHYKLKKSMNFDRKNCVAVTENTFGNNKEVPSAKVIAVMGNENNIGISKIKADSETVKHCKLKKWRNFDRKNCVAVTENTFGNNKEVQSAKVVAVPESKCEVVDFTSTESEVLTNINESLNFNNFGKELIRKVPYKPVNKIKFNFNKNI